MARYSYLFFYSYIEKKKVDDEAVGLLSELRDKVVPSLLDQDRTISYNIPWGPGISVTTHADYLKKFAGMHFNFMFLVRFYICHCR